MARKLWFNIYARRSSSLAITNDWFHVARAKSSGVAYIVAEKLREIYDGVEIR